ncbi:hypothetical protein [Parasitella parasitica]|uniref:Zinc finger PHD-type domain-containing protein n=1 Tax=Parasitella parasitica TaxID=35722 RepID=A0A0B7N6V1_9FUNG|nr:hypothetical protein [Parasitella parasitica]
MVVHRRGGRPSRVGRKKQRAPPRRRRSQSSSDENSSDGGSITRCICGETRLMVQCDKCEVWQHCECMGLEQPNIPDHYYCEQCKPENHKSLRQSNGRTKRQYVSTERAASIAKAPKKRMTLNSREASMSLEDVLAARNALEMYESHKDGDSPPSSSSPPPLSNYAKDALTQADNPPSNAAPVTALTAFPKSQNDNSTAIKENGDKSNKRKRDSGIKLPDTIEEKPEPPSSTVSSVGHEELAVLREEIPEPELITPKQPSSTPVRPKRKQTKQSDKKTTGRVNGKVNGGGKRGKPRSRTSTPVRESSPIGYNELDDEGKDSSEDGISSVLFDHFSPTARASSPPAKTRHPHARMSISEMNRRANQILEYISSIQVEMASKGNDDRAGHGNTTKSTMTIAATNHINTITATVAVDGPEQMKDGDDDDNDSLSSASTIPLARDAEDDEDMTGPLNNDNQSSMEIMDMLTRKLIKFQKRFGSRNRALYEEALMEGEGRVTRSREASGNINALRNMMPH